MLTDKEQLIFDRFKNDFRDFLIEQIDEFIKVHGLQIDINSKRYLDKANCEDLLSKYLYNKQKIPSGKKRIHLSKEIMRSPLYKVFHKRISILCNILKQGKSIAPYLTTHANNLKFEDRLLNDWGIIHLHLQPIGQRNPATDGILLFAYFYGEDVFLVNIGNHRSFADKTLLEIIDNNWPQLLDSFAGTKAPNLTDKEIIELRKYNIGYALHINDKVLATQTDSIRNRMLPTISIFRIIEDIARIVVSNEQVFEEAIKTLPAEHKVVEIHLSFDAKNREVVLYDSKTMVGFKFNNADYLEVFSNVLRNTNVF